jgi:hypothetical protein
VTTFAERFLAATAFEGEVIERLNTSGWQAFHFGQTQLPEECRNLLRRFEDSSRRPCLIRWLPDIITFRTYAGGRVFVALIDAKACGDRPNYAIEMSAQETAEALTDQLFTPTFFVFDDWKVMAPRDVRQRGVAGSHNGNGSGTPYLLVSKKYGRPFDEIFPPRRDGAA